MSDEEDAWPMDDVTLAELLLGLAAEEDDEDDEVMLSRPPTSRTQRWATGGRPPAGTITRDPKSSSGDEGKARVMRCSDG